MKIMLVVPTHGYTSVPSPLLSVSDFPTGLAYIAGALKQAGHEVIGVNPNNAPNGTEAYYLLTNKFFAALEKAKPDLIGLGGICTDYPFLRDAMNLLRKLSPETPVVLGGGIISHDREFIFNLLQPDFGLVGEAEETMVQLTDTIAKGLTDFSHIPNLSYWEKGHPVFNPRDTRMGDVNARPMPDYEPFNVQDMVDNYSLATRLLYRYSRTHPRPFPLVTARGCPFNCTFCIHRGNQVYRPLSMAKVMEEIRVFYDRYKFNIAIIVDELFALDRDRMQDFCYGILEGRVKHGWDFDWMFQTHAKANLDYDTLKLAKEAGCIFFSYGIESASPTVLESMNKKATPDQFIEAIRLADEVGIAFGGNLIFGDVAETQLTIYESLDFFFKHCSTASVFLGLLTPFPGNKLFDTCLERGIIKDKSEYYANIGQGVFNMTSMSDSTWQHWVNFLILLERSWLWVKDTTALYVEKEEYSDPVVQHYNADMYRIRAVCPYCHQEITYREMIGRHQESWPLFLGLNCHLCNKRIRINLDSRLLGRQPALEMMETMA